MKIKVQGRAGVALFAVLGGGAFVAAPLIVADGQLHTMPNEERFFAALFVLVGLSIIARGLWDAARIGFRVSDAGIHGAHHAEREVISWSRVERLTWGEATELRRRAGRNARVEVTGNVLYAQLHDGRKVRITQNLTHKFAVQEHINEQLRHAAAQGLIPVPLGPADLPPPLVTDAEDDQPVSWPTH